MPLSTKGKVPERSIGAVSKTVVPLRVPRVRIPAFPQKELQAIGLWLFCVKSRNENPGALNLRSRSKSSARIAIWSIFIVLCIHSYLALAALFFNHSLRTLSGRCVTLKSENDALNPLPSGQAANMPILTGWFASTHALRIMWYSLSSKE